GRSVDDAGVGTPCAHRLRDRVPDREALVHGAALAGRHAAHDVGAVLAHLLGMEGPGCAGQALHHEPGFLAHQDAHDRLTSSTIFLAPSAMSRAGVSARPLSARILRPSSTLVPSSRTTSR